MLFQFLEEILIDSDLFMSSDLKTLVNFEVKTELGGVATHPTPKLMGIVCLTPIDSFENWVLQFDLELLCRDSAQVKSCIAGLVRAKRDQMHLRRDLDLW